MTSANVINYIIRDKEDNQVGTHRQNIMCHTCNDGLEKFTPASDFTIQAWGYDEEDEKWENEPENLETWLSKYKASITFKKFEAGDIINVRKIGECKVIERFEVFKKDNNWFPVYDVKKSDGEVITINQNDIKP